MPIYEHVCSAEACSLYCVPVEHFYHRRDVAPPPCDECGGPTVRAVSMFAAPWTGDLSRFFDPKAEATNSTKYGHMAYRTKSSRMIDGSPEPVHIETRADQLAFCKAEGLIDPTDVNPNIGTTENGQVSTSRPKGAWV